MCNQPIAPGYPIMQTPSIRGRGVITSCGKSVVRFVKGALTTEGLQSGYSHYRGDVVTTERVSLMY